MLEARIREEVKVALREKNEIRKNILRVVLGEVETEQCRGKTVDDDRIIEIMHTISVSNIKVMQLNKGPIDTLVTENQVLDEFLPHYLTIEEIKLKLEPKLEEIKSKEKGPAIGMAVKSLSDYYVDNDDVKQAVIELRGE